jgi:hypothetical protein
MYHKRDQEINTTLNKNFESQYDHDLNRKRSKS